MIDGAMNIMCAQMTMSVEMANVLSRKHCSRKNGSGTRNWRRANTTSPAKPTSNGRTKPAPTDPPDSNMVAATITSTKPPEYRSADTRSKCPG